jgi:hypothetical protein
MSTRAKAATATCGRGRAIDADRPVGLSIGHHCGMTTVFLLWHQRTEDDEGMLLGVYSTSERAEKRQSEAVRLPGFRLFPDKFVIDPYEIDKDMWTEGFAIPTADGLGWEPDPEPPPISN